MEDVPISVLLRGRLDQIQPSMRRVAKAVLADPHSAAGPSLSSPRSAA